MSQTNVPSLSETVVKQRVERAKRAEKRNVLRYVSGPQGNVSTNTCNRFNLKNNRPTASPHLQSRYAETMGLLHNLGDGCRHTATAVAAWRSPRRGEIFMTAISSPRRHSSPFGDTHRHMATPIAIWRQASPRRDSRDNLITFCIQLVPMLSKRWQAGEIKKAKVEALQPYRHPR